MKTIFALILAALCAASLSGCATATQKNAGGFLAKVAQMNITAADVSQSTVTPIYSHHESLSGLKHDAASFSVENLKADFAIPLWGVQWTFSASAISATSPQMLAQVAQAAQTAAPATK
jgi:type IV pilus biogenesis protein CpaD/CtpE